MHKLTKIAIGTLTMIGLAGLATAGDPKAPTPAAPTGAAKAGDMHDMPKMDMTPPKELADMAKNMSGTWKCKGQGMDGPDMKMADMTATMTPKLEMNGWWIHDSFDAKMGKDGYHFEAYTTYDSKAKKYHRVMAEMGGGWSTGDSTGMMNGKMDWDLTMHGMMGEMPFRDHVDASDPKAGMKAWGEMSMDGGKTWTKVYEMTCKK
jgi:hypothetical protein